MKKTNQFVVVAVQRYSVYLKKQHQYGKACSEYVDALMNIPENELKEYVSIAKKTYTDYMTRLQRRKQG